MNAGLGAAMSQSHSDKRIKALEEKVALLMVSVTQALEGIIALNNAIVELKAIGA